MLRSRGGAVIYWDRFAETVYGWSSAEANGRNVSELPVPEASEAQGREIMASLVEGRSWSGEFVVRRRDGTSFLSLVTDSPLRDSSGELVGVIGVSIDISAHRRAEDAQARLAAIVTSSDDAILAMDLDGTITDWNRGAEVVYGYTSAEMVGQSMRLLMPPREAAEVSMLRVRVMRGERLEQFHTVRLHKSGHPDRRVGEHRAHSKPKRGIIGAASIGRDITERVKADAALAHQALHDGLTGLPNRSLLHIRLHELLTTAAKDHSAVALLLLDLDRFKEVNDTLGHHVGDVLLQEIAQRLQGAVRASDLVARLGGDEFALLIPACTSGAAEEVAQAVVAILQVPFVLEGQFIEVGASIGIALSPDHGLDADSLLRSADVAMYQAKRSGTGVAAIRRPRISTGQTDSPCSPSYATRSTPSNWCCTTNPSWTCATASWSVSRRWCAGSTLDAGFCHPARSSRWPKSRG